MLCQQEADATNSVIALANRLVGGLASENVRWAEAVHKYIIKTTFCSFDSFLFLQLRHSRGNASR